MNRKIIVVGGSGLVGSKLISVLLKNDENATVVALLRHKIELKHPNLKQEIIDFNHLENHADVFQGCHAVYCSLGTTLKNAGSRGQFYKIDYQLVAEIAKLSKQSAVKQFVYVSSMGANSNSSIYYSRVKGKVEEYLKRLNFERLIIVRPSILFGDRKEVRVKETIGIAVAKALHYLMLGPLKKYRGISANTVAKAMYNASIRNGNRLLTIESDMIEEMGT